MKESREGQNTLKFLVNQIDEDKEEYDGRSHSDPDGTKEGRILTPMV